MRKRAIAAACLIVILAAPDAQAVIQIAPAPSLEAVTTPAGVLEYRKAIAVAVVRPRAVASPPCLAVHFADFLRDWFPIGWLGADVCGPRERSRRYVLDVRERLKGAPSRSILAILNGAYPLDPDFMRKRRPDLWGEVFDLDAELAAERHAGFSFLDDGVLSRRTLNVEARLDPPRLVDGSVHMPMLDPNLDYVVFLEAENRVAYWEPIARGGADRDLLVQRLRRLKAGDVDVRLTVAPADLFGRFMDAAIYEGGDCRPRMVGGHKISSMNQGVSDMWGSPLAGPNHCGLPPSAPKTERYLALVADPSSLKLWSYSQHGAVVRLLPIIDGKVRPGDLVSQLRVLPDAPIPVEQVLAMVGTDLSENDRWVGTRVSDPPLRLPRAQ